MLTQDEEKLIIDHLERNPTIAEVAVFDALWSEHCSYKSTKRWFKLFNTQGEHVALGIGEGAGLLDVGNNWLVGLGLESHNHPSAIDPFNGAATGVGGIIRDIVSQGCKPIAVLDCLRFGYPNSNRQKLLLDQVVLGISSYGNCVGVPNLGGDMEFSNQFEANPLVNAMCVGTVRKDKIIRSIANTPGDKYLLFGARTGRDGIGGVSFASENLDDSANKESRGSVQIGDPLTEKILIDMILQLNKKGLFNGLQDLGGGGLVCAAAEMAHRGGVGAKLYLENIPVKAQNMQGWELLISESQERMLAVVNPKNIQKITKLLDMNEMPWAVVGEVIKEKRFQAFMYENFEVDCDIDFLISGFPEPIREVNETFQEIFENRITYEGNIQVLDLFLSKVDLASRQSVYQQYDQHVQGNTTIPAGYGAGGIKLPNKKYLAVAAGTNSYLVGQFQKEGAFAATLEIARKIFARGAKPIGMVDSLNFGNPDYTTSYGEFVEAVKGVAAFSHEFDTPVVGGNVSLYNETKSHEKHSKILPSPFVGLVGIRKNMLHSVHLESGMKVYLVGESEGILEGSQFERYFITEDSGSEIILNIELEHKLAEFMHALDLPISSGHIGRGGLLLSLFKWLITAEIGFQGISELESWTIEQIFGEHTPRYFIATSIEYETLLRQKCDEQNISITYLGEIRPNEIKFGTFLFSLHDLKQRWEQPMQEALEV